jgi:hypothetical protein
VVTISLIGALSVISACSPSAPSATPNKPARVTKSDAPVAEETLPDGYVRVSNRLCPILTDHAIRKGRVLRELSAEHKGQTIGFCCEDCVDAWKAMSDDERDEAIKQAAKLASDRPR